MVNAIEWTRATFIENVIIGAAARPAGESDSNIPLMDAWINCAPVYVAERDLSLTLGCQHTAHA
jgi:hypothetical protein